MYDEVDGLTPLPDIHQFSYISRLFVFTSLPRRKPGMETELWAKRDERRHTLPKGKTKVIRIVNEKSYFHLQGTQARGW